jgi:uncharacterized protein
MYMKILDTNVLLYCSDVRTEFHGRVQEFVSAALARDEVIALPWMTVLGFLRISTRRIAGRETLTREQAVAIIDTWLSHPNVSLLEPGPRHWQILREISEAAQARGDLIMDAHLAALAIENGAELCSTDTDFSRFPRLKWTDPTRAA